MRRAGLLLVLTTAVGAHPWAATKADASGLAAWGISRVHQGMTHERTGGRTASSLARAPSEPGITLVWLDVERQLPAMAPIVGAEVMAILESAGVPLRWRVGRPGEPTLITPDGHVELPVIVKAEEHIVHRRHRRALGATLAAGGPQPIWVLVEPLRRLLGQDRLLVRSKRHQLVLARAVGRVVAHELVHCLAPDHGHSSEGLMQAVFGARDLHSPHAPLDDDCLFAMRRGWARLVQQALAPDGGSPHVRAN